MKIVKNIVFVLFALLFMNAGLNKFFNYLQAPPMEGEMKVIMEALMTLKWITPLTGAVEVVAALLIIMPKTRALGAIMIVPIMVGIICHHITLMPEGTAIAAVLLLINGWMIADNWNKYKPMIS